MIRLIIILSIVLVTSGCLKTESTSGTTFTEDSESNAIADPIEDPNQIVSVLGNILPPKQLSRNERTKRQSNLEQARSNYEANPDSLENIIWYGRRLSYLGEYQKAIQIYSQGLAKYPESFKLLRHRGHRYLTVRNFDAAIDDLIKAAFFARDYDNAIEPDGIPNRLNQPLSNNQFNIWYHLGISYYLKGNFDKAISSFNKCMDVSDNNDLLVATTNWFYMTYQKIGNSDAATELLEIIPSKMVLIENYRYHDLLMLYKGLKDPEDILDKISDENNSLEPTIGYGIGSWYLSKGQVDMAKDIFEKILRNPGWDSFGYIATEVDYANLIAS